MTFNKTIWILAFSLSVMQTSIYSQGMKTGIEGHIFRISGNRMPSPDSKPSAPRGEKSVLYIYELTTLSQVTRQGETAFYSSIRTRLVKTAQSDESGYFFASLPPGEYSLFTKKDALFYANNFDGNNHISPVKVVRNKVSRVDVNIDYDATF